MTKGFQQIDVTVSSEVVHYAVKNLDGIVGWLTLFGTRRRDNNKGSEEVVDEVVSEADRLARAEALRFTVRSKRYGIILNFLARVSESSWSQNKTIVEIKESHSITTATIPKFLNTIVKSGFVEKQDCKYVIADPLIISFRLSALKRFC